MYGGRGSAPEYQRNQMSRPQMEPAGGGRSMVQDSPAELLAAAIGNEAADCDSAVL